MKRKWLVRFILCLMVPGALFASSAEQRWVAHYEAADTLPDYPNRLVWQDSAFNASEKLDFHEAQTYCKTLTLAGANDWRLPTIAELIGLYDKKEVLTHSDKGSYWSSSLKEESGIQYRQGVRFRNGVYGRTSPASRLFVRCVREGAAKIEPKTKKRAAATAKTATTAVTPTGAGDSARERAEHERRQREKHAREKAQRAEAQRKQAALQAALEKERLERQRLENLKKVALVDAAGGLIWQDDSDTAKLRKTWDQASVYCASLTLAGYEDWVLPTPEELAGLYAMRPSLKHFDEKFYWTSAEKTDETRLAEYVHFGNGDRYWTYKTRKNCIRCVRHP